MSLAPEPRTVLVADDDVGLVLLIERQLQREGFATVGVSTGAEAIEWLGRNRADLMLLDFKLPDMTGQELIDRLGKAQLLIPFIVITGQGDERIAVDLMKRGAHDYLIKDSALVDLLPVVVGQQIDRLSRDRRLVTAEAALIESEAKLRTLMESSPDVIMNVQRDGTILYINQAIESVPVSQMVGSSSVDLLPPEPRDRYRRSLDAAFEQARGYSFEHYGPGDSWHEVRIVPIRQDEQVVTAMVVSTDVTDRRRDQEALVHRTRALEQTKGDLQQANAALETLVADLERSNAELKEFAYVSSHDLQEPLRTVSSYCQLLRRRYSDQLDATANEFLDAIVGGAKRMQRLIEDLLAFSRVERRNRPPEPVDLRAVTEQVLADLQAAISENDARIEVAELPTVLGDRIQLGQVFQNLMGNALKFRGDQPLVVEISAQPTDDGWQITVADNGIGIEPQYADRVFRVFQRLHTREAYPGTGIGLAVCKKIVERHGGRIWIDRDRQVGTAVHFTISSRVDGES